MIFEFYHCSVCYDEIYAASSTKPRNGTTVAGVIDAAKKYGFYAEAVKGDREAFFSEFPLPCIAHVRTGKKNFHYVVIYEKSKQNILIADPAIGFIDLKPEEFLDGNRRRFSLIRYQWSGILIFIKK